MSRYQTLRRLLIKISYTSPFPPDQLLSAAPPHLTLPVLSHVFLSYSPLLTAHFLSSGFLLSSSAFSLSALYGLLHAVFGYHPQLSQQQFSSERGYVERKLQLLCDVLQMCVTKAEELEREKGIGGSGSKAGVPRVAVILKDQKRSAGESHTRSGEQPQKPASSARIQRHDKREEEKMQRRDEEELEDDNSSSQLLQHQHVSFTHDDSSQPLSPSHLSPPSHSQSSPQRLSPPSRSYSQSQPAPSNAAVADPLLALHQQLHRISHRTNQLVQPPQPTPTNQHEHSSQSAVIEQLVQRLQAMETTVQDELAGIRKELHDVRQKLAAVEQRDTEREQRESAGPAKAEAEESKEASTAMAERVTNGDVSDGIGTRAVSAGENSLPSDMSEFLTHMNDRLSSTAKLLESSRRARGRLSEGE